MHIAQFEHSTTDTTGSRSPVVQRGYEYFKKADPSLTTNRTKLLKQHGCSALSQQPEILGNLHSAPTISGNFAPYGSSFLDLCLSSFDKKISKMVESFCLNLLVMERFWKIGSFLLNCVHVLYYNQPMATAAEPEVKRLFKRALSSQRLN